MPNTPELDYHHIPVLLNEVLLYLDPKPGQSIVDATLGGGGYTRAILEKVGSDGKLLALDADLDAVENIKSQMPGVKGLVVVHSNFRDIDKAVKNHDFPSPDGVVADLGLSSYQLDQSGRGISFQKDELLDMRFNQAETEDDAKFILQNRTLEELTGIFRDFGEEKFSYQIAKKIVEQRNKKPIQYTGELLEIIREALPKPMRHKAEDTARRIFQALRIEVNHELVALQTFLPKAFDLLNPGGRMVIVSFHSLEDRIVKQFFQDAAKGCICPPDFPQCLCGRTPKATILTKKPITASQKELTQNSRSKPAKLRALLKL